MLSLLRIFETHNVRAPRKACKYDIRIYIVYTSFKKLKRRHFTKLIRANFKNSKIGVKVLNDFHAYFSLLLIY